MRVNEEHQAGCDCVGCCASVTDGCLNGTAALFSGTRRVAVAVGVATWNILSNPYIWYPVAAVSLWFSAHLIMNDHTWENTIRHRADLNKLYLTDGCFELLDTTVPALRNNHDGDAICGHCSYLADKFGTGGEKFNNCVSILLEICKTFNGGFTHGCTGNGIHFAPGIFAGSFIIAFTAIATIGLFVWTTSRIGEDWRSISNTCTLWRNNISTRAQLYRAQQASRANENNLLVNGKDDNVQLDPPPAYGALDDLTP